MNGVYASLADRVASLLQPLAFHDLQVVTK
jgi:hypothetical protein